MAYVEKYNLPFVNVQGQSCSVHFFFEGWGGDSTELTGGAKPFVLGEYNTDEDYFKPVRPQQATIEIIAKASTVTIDDFLADNDSDIYVRFDFGDWEGYWYGYLSQEDLQETWIDTVHILTLRATEGIGELKNIPLTDDAGFNLQGIFTPLDYMAYALDKTIHTLIDATIISNLFHTSMTLDFDQTGLDQCYVDARTFERSPTVFDDAYTVLEKINRAWSQTIFQYNGAWFIYRLPEIFKIYTNPLIGFINNTPSRTPISERYDIQVGVNEIVYPVVPDMLRFLLKPSKETKITYTWENFEEIVCNETFQRGDFISESLSQLVYDIDCWTIEAPPLSAPVADGATFQRIINYNGDGHIEDEYARIRELTYNQSWARSSRINVSEGEQLVVSLNVKWELAHSKSNCRVMYVLFEGDSGTFYSLNQSGNYDWAVDPGFYVNPAGNIFIDYATATATEWNEINFTAKEFPEGGYVDILLVHEADFLVIPVGDDIYFKDLKIDIKNAVQLRTNRDIKGDYDRYTIANNLNKNFEDEIFLDDANSKNHKGAIFESDGYTLTGDEWYRRAYDTERFTFKRQNALAHWFMNRSYKSKIDVNLFGLTYLKDDVEYPIGLMNTINFVDDAPTKTFAIANLKEIDFMSCQWQATLIEVYDTDVPDDVPGETDIHDFKYIYGNKS